MTNEKAKVREIPNVINELHIRSYHIIRQHDGGALIKSPKYPDLSIRPAHKTNGIVTGAIDTLYTAVSNLGIDTVEILLETSLMFHYDAVIDGTALHMDEIMDGQLCIEPAKLPRDKYTKHAYAHTVGIFNHLGPSQGLTIEQMTQMVKVLDLFPRYDTPTLTHLAVINASHHNTMRGSLRLLKRMFNCRSNHILFTKYAIPLTSLNIAFRNIIMHDDIVAANEFYQEVVAMAGLAYYQYCQLANSPVRIKAFIAYMVDTILTAKYEYHKVYLSRKDRAIISRMYKADVTQCVLCALMRWPVYSLLPTELKAYVRAQYMDISNRAEFNYLLGTTKEATTDEN